MGINIAAWLYRNGTGIFSGSWPLCGSIDREQAKVVAGFGSTTRANARLLALTRAGLLRRFFLGTTAGGAKALYALSLKGARLVGVPENGPRRRQDEAVVADFFIQHQLAINEVYCSLKYGNRSPNGITFERWMGFPKQPVPGLRLIPDGYVELETPSGTAGRVPGSRSGARASASVAGQSSATISTLPSPETSSGSSSSIVSGCSWSPIPSGGSTRSARSSIP